MKKTDIAAVILIAAFSVLIAYFTAKTILGDPSEESVTVKTATAISTDLDDPNPDIFNDKAINPTVEVIIGDDSNQQTGTVNADDGSNNANNATE